MQISWFINITNASFRNFMFESLRSQVVIFLEGVRWPEGDRRGISRNILSWSGLVTGVGTVCEHFMEPYSYVLQIQLIWTQLCNDRLGFLCLLPFALWNRSHFDATFSSAEPRLWNQSHSEPSINQHQLLNTLPSLGLCVLLPKPCSFPWLQGQSRPLLLSLGLSL